jgi:hypothetical protein
VGLDADGSISAAATPPHPTNTGPNLSHKPPPRKAYSCESRIAHIRTQLWLCDTTHAADPKWIEFPPLVQQFMSSNQTHEPPQHHSTCCQNSCTSTAETSRCSADRTPTHIERRSIETNTEFDMLWGKVMG